MRLGLGHWSITRTAEHSSEARGLAGMSMGGAGCVTGALGPPSRPRGRFPTLCTTRADISLIKKKQNSRRGDPWAEGPPRVSVLHIFGSDQKSIQNIDIFSNHHVL